MTERFAAASPAVAAVHDRDLNAARNILAAGRAEGPTAVELMSDPDLSSQSALKQEPAGSGGLGRADVRGRPPPFT